MAIFIAVCDDEIEISSELERYLMDIFSKLNIKYEIDVYYSGFALCEKMKVGAHYDLIFLDIEFAKGEINGVEVGKFIREAHQNDTVSIVYMSWEKRYSLQLHDIQPLNFIIKPMEFEKVEQVVKKHLARAEIWFSHLTYKFGHDIYKVRVRDIAYVESQGRKLILHLANGVQEVFYGSLKGLYKEQLQRFNFLFIHVAYAVNYDHVKLYRYDEIVLENNVTLPISQTRRKAIRDSFSAINKRRM